MPKMKNMRHELYCQARLRGMSETAAWRSAGYRGKWGHKKSTRIEHLPSVQARIAELNSKVERAAILSKQEALGILSGIARTRVTDFLEGDGAACSLNEMAKRGYAGAIKELTVDRGPGGSTCKRMRLTPPTEAIQIMARLEGWEAPQRVETTTKRIEEMTLAELDALDGGPGNGPA